MGGATTSATKLARPILGLFKARSRKPTTLSWTADAFDDLETRAYRKTCCIIVSCFRSLINSGVTAVITRPLNK